jgi:hypothetical protein
MSLSDLEQNQCAADMYALFANIFYNSVCKFRRKNKEKKGPNLALLGYLPILFK